MLIHLQNLFLLQVNLEKKREYLKKQTTFKF